MTYYDYRISNGVSSLISGSGTISITINTLVVTGSGTAFRTDLHVGDILIIGGIPIGSIFAVINDGSAYLNYNVTAGVSGAVFQADPLVNVETLGDRPSPPKGDYQPWSIALPTGDALARGLGRPLAQWRWNFGPTDFLTDALRDALRAYCTGKSARVYIRTRTFESTDKFATFQAAVLWPDKEDRDFKGFRKGFVLDFRDLIAL